MEFLHSFLRLHFVQKPVAVLQNVGWFLKLSINKLSVTNLTNNYWLLVNYYMVSHGPWKVLENWKNWGISLKSPRIFHRSPRIFLKACWIKITFVNKRGFAQGKDWKHSSTQIFSVIMKVCFLLISMFPRKFIFCYLKCPRNPASRGKVLRLANPPPSTNLKGLYFMSFYVKLQGKEVCWKLIFVLEKSLTFLPKFCLNHVLNKWFVQWGRLHLQGNFPYPFEQ